MTNQAAAFEGPEKKLEIILRRPARDLRADPDGRWEAVVAATRSRIISRRSNNHLDAYLLSESSLFVWEDRILMITCGRTALTRALPEILSFVSSRDVEFVFYQRKNLMYPNDQPSDFEREVAYLEGFFKGKSYRLGPANHDHVHVFYSSHNKTRPAEDATFEVLMHGLSPTAMEYFAAGSVGSAAASLRLSRLGDVYPDMLTDCYLFAPCGFSVNGIHEDRYFTVHVTPQPNGSYASFETNIMERDYRAVVHKILSIFRPTRFSLVLTTSVGNHLGARPVFPLAPEGYRAVERSLYEFDCGYAITFTNHVL